MSDSVVVRSARPEDHEEVLALLATALGWDADEGLPEYFTWKHRTNPLGPSPEWVAEVDGRIAGFRTFLRWEFEDATGRRHRAVRAVDTATHPDFRGRGIFRDLTLGAVAAMTADGIDFVFNTPNDQSRPGYLKMGWHAVGRLPTAVRPTGVRGAARLLGARVAAERRPLADGGGASATDLLADARLDDLLARIAPPTGLRTHRTAAHLRWRYGHPPLGYRAVAVGDDPAAGIAVYRVRRRGTAREAALCRVGGPGTPRCRPRDRRRRRPPGRRRAAHRRAAGRPPRPRHLPHRIGSACRLRSRAPARTGTHVARPRRPRSAPAPRGLGSRAR
ncbi:MAG: GNAT family N-acetyltransferase [Actinomycetota bacterium]